VGIVAAQHRTGSQRAADVWQFTRGRYFAPAPGRRVAGAVHADARGGPESGLTPVDRKWLGYAVMAFIGYELLAYFINRSGWQKGGATGDYSGQMPLDFLGQMIGYGGTPIPPPNGGSGATVGVPPPLRPALPVFHPVPIPPPHPHMPDPVH